MSYDYAIEKVSVEAPGSVALLNRLMVRVTQENQLNFSLTTMARILKMSRATLDNQFKELCRIGAIVPDPALDDMTRGIYKWRICPLLIWRGTSESLREYLRSLPETHSFWAFNDPVSKIQPTPELVVSQPSEPEIL